MKHVAAAVLLLAAGCQSKIRCPMPQRIVVLGTAQDAGRPHLGCAKDCCASAAARGEHERVAALGLRLQHDAWWLVDATPDLPAQVRAMGSLPSGILLTHAHVGHYTGLMYLGREGLNAQAMPVHCSEAMAEFLRANAPWDQLVRLGNIALHPFRSGALLRLDGDRLVVEAIRVPHRDEYADTHAFGIRMEDLRHTLYLPDLDRWEAWERDLGDVAAAYPVWLVDGSFFSGDELGGRDLSVIPHPPVAATMELLQQRVNAKRLEVWFTHLNHTNPLWDPGSDAAREVASRGFHVARTGQQFTSDD